MKNTFVGATCLCVQEIVKSGGRRDGVSMANCFVIVRILFFSLSEMSNKIWFCLKRITFIALLRIDLGRQGQKWEISLKASAIIQTRDYGKDVRVPMEFLKSSQTGCILKVDLPEYSVSGNELRMTSFVVVVALSN